MYICYCFGYYIIFYGSSILHTTFSRYISTQTTFDNYHYFTGHYFTVVTTSLWSLLHWSLLHCGHYFTMVTRKRIPLLDTLIYFLFVYRTSFYTFNLFYNFYHGFVFLQHYVDVTSQCVDLNKFHFYFNICHLLHLKL